MMSLDPVYNTQHIVYLVRQQTIHFTLTRDVQGAHESAWTVLNITEEQFSNFSLS